MKLLEDLQKDPNEKNVIWYVDETGNSFLDVVGKLNVRTFPILISNAVSLGQQVLRQVGFAQHRENLCF